MPMSAGDKTEVIRRVLLEALLTARRSDDLQRDVQHFFTTKHDTTVELLQDAVDAGVIDPDVDVNALAFYSTVVACGLAAFEAAGVEIKGRHLLGDLMERIAARAYLVPEKRKRVRS